MVIRREVLRLPIGMVQRFESTVRVESITGIPATDVLLQHGSKSQVTDSGPNLRNKQNTSV